MKITKKKNQNKMMEVPLHPRLRKFNFKSNQDGFFLFKGNLIITSCNKDVKRLINPFNFFYD